MQTYKQIALMFVTAGLLAFLAYPATVHAENSSDSHLSQIVDSMIRAYGGKAEIAKVTTVVAKGTIKDFMKEAEGNYTRYYSRPGKLRIEIMPEQGGEARILNSGRGWRGSPENLKKTQRVALQAMIYQYSYLDLPMGLSDNAYTVTYGGQQLFRGRPLDLLVIDIKGAPKLRVYVDPEKKLIVRVASDFDMGMGASELVTEYEDFRAVGKVLFPFRLINYAGEMRLSVISLSDIKVNAEIPDEVFSPVPLKVQ